MAVLLIFRFLISYVRPEQTHSQKKQVAQFVHKIDYIQEFAGTPRVVILFRIIRSIAAPRSYTYLHDVFQAKNLRKDFMQVVDSFK